MRMSTETDKITIKASEFKAKCLKLMDHVAETGEEFVISKNGRPIPRRRIGSDPEAFSAGHCNQNEERDRA